jgi:hypothetical protein
MKLFAWDVAANGDWCASGGRWPNKHTRTTVSALELRVAEVRQKRLLFLRPGFRQRVYQHLRGETQGPLEVKQN